MKEILNGMIAVVIAGVLLAPASLLADTISYDYDALHRLVAVTYPNGDRITYRYDPAGNRTQRIVTVITATDIDHDGVTNEAEVLA